MTKDAEMVNETRPLGRLGHPIHMGQKEKPPGGLAADDHLRQLPPESDLTRHCRGYTFGALEGGEYRLGYPEPL